MQINICDVVIAITVGGMRCKILLTLVQIFFLVSRMMAYGFWLSGFPDAFASQIPHSSQEF
jgi:hypothetical protein